MNDLSQVATELRNPLKRFPTIALDRRPMLAFARFVTRFARTVGTDGVSIENVVEGATRVRLYQPTGSRSGAALVWAHGGGLIAGHSSMDDVMLGRVAAEFGMVVVSVTYRLAPEHPYPAPLDDYVAGWDWLQANAPRLSVDPDRVALGGESAGGNLAASAAQRLRDRGETQPVAVWLMCPMLDDRTAVRSDIGDLDHRVWNNRNNRFAWRSYLRAEPGSAGVPEYAAPARRGDLSGLPPTWIGVADLDLFAREDLDYGRRLRDAGVSTEIDQVDGAPHGFQTWGAGTPLVEEYLGRARSWLASVTGSSPRDSWEQV